MKFLRCLFLFPPKNTEYFEVKENMKNEPLCDKSLTHDEFEAFRNAIENEYVFDLVVDGLHVRTSVGLLVNSSSYYLRTNLFFLVSHDYKNATKSIDIVSRPEDFIDISNDFSEEVHFKFSVQFKKGLEESYLQKTKRYFSNFFVPFQVEMNRMENALKKSYNETKMHFFGVTNSLLLSVTLIVVAGIISFKDNPKELEKTERKNQKDEAKEPKIQKNSELKDWKSEAMIVPRSFNLLCAAFGSGIQLFFLVF